MAREPSRNEEVRAIWKAYKFFYQVFGGVLLVGLGVLIGAIFFSEPGERSGYLVNLYTSLLSVALTVFVIDLLSRRRDERRDNARLKAQLEREVSSSDNGIALRALNELIANGWLYDVDSIRSFTRANLKGANLQHAVLKQFWFQSTIFEHADLSVADFEACRFTGAMLKRANLARANLKNANLHFANLAQTYVGGANFENAYLVWVNFQQADFSEIYYAVFSMDTSEAKSGTFSVNLRGANLTNADLQGAYNFDKAIFSEDTILPDATKWVKGTDITRFTNPKHPNFWKAPAPPDDVSYYP
ncbi:MAG: pentapeptide repeat-containing protein [Anaerolineae bacterium]